MAINDPWLLYGANGYTGELIAREAVRRGMKPTLAGRSKDKIQNLGAELDCPISIYDLDDHTALVRSLEGKAAVLNCAGPFKFTARSMMQACLVSHVHYFDITGEIDVFELGHSVDEKARRAGMVLCPGVGFDVVPTDCIALKLRLAMPDATHLALGFDANSGMSKGTAKTSIESAGEGGKVRREGKIVSVPLAAETRRIDFGGGERLAVSIPWGDVSTAFHTTSIPNIDVFIATSQQAINTLRRANSFSGLLRQRWLRGLLKLGVGMRLRPPTQAQRDNNASFVWGEARNAEGKKITARVKTANGYTLTVHSSLGILGEVLAGVPDPGFSTPALLVGPDYVSTLPGSTEIRLDS